MNPLVHLYKDQWTSLQTDEPPGPLVLGPVNLPSDRWAPWFSCIRTSEPPFGQMNPLVHLYKDQWTSLQTDEPPGPLVLGPVNLPSDRWAPWFTCTRTSEPPFGQMSPLVQLYKDQWTSLQTDEPSGLLVLGPVNLPLDRWTLWFTCTRTSEPPFRQMNPLVHLY